MPLGMNIEAATYLIKIIIFKNNFFIQIEGSNIYRVINVFNIHSYKRQKIYVNLSLFSITYYAF